MMRVKTWPAQLLSAVLAVAMLSGALPCRPAWAEFVGTESVVTPATAPERMRVLEREDGRAQLQPYGVSADEAAAPLGALTDREVAIIAARLDDSAGGDPFGALIGLTLLGAA